MNMPVAQLLLVYVVLLLGALAVAALYTDLRQRRFLHRRSSDRIFRCSKCGSVYTDDPDVDRSRCAQCGQMNEPIEF
jgi:predicted Zn-ribbon and HTH transcriptional regulator